MKKEDVGREVIKLRLCRWSFQRIQKEIQRKYEYLVSRKTLKRWYKRFERGEWNLRDASRRPWRIYYKFAREDFEQVLALRKKTGFSSYQLRIKLKKKGLRISESTIKNVLREHVLSRGNKMEGIRLKWVCFQREHPNSMWQIDGTVVDDGSWFLPVIDDCSRYCIALGRFEHMTTANVILLLERAIKMHGKPREILTDNGPEYGGRSPNSDFDKWCRKRNIKHIRSGIHKPTTVGKVSRLQYTITYELEYCFNDYEYFRYRYNHERPHRSLEGKTPAEVYFRKLF